MSYTVYEANCQMGMSTHSSVFYFVYTRLFIYILAVVPLCIVTNSLLAAVSKLYQEEHIMLS